MANYLRWNTSTHILEISLDDGGSWSPIALDGSIITEGTINAARIPDLAMSKITTGDLAWSRVDKTSSSLADLATKSAAALTSGTLDKDRYADFVASGASHAKGAVPDPGASSGTTKFLREDASWQVPPAPSSPVCRLYNSANIAIASDAGLGTYTTLTWDTEDIDTDTMHDTSTNPSRITIKTAGKYAIGGFARLQTPSATVRCLGRLFLNNTTIIALDDMTYAGYSPVCVAPFTVYDFAVDDYIEFGLTQNHGTNRNSQFAANYVPCFYAHKVG